MLTVVAATLPAAVGLNGTRLTLADPSRFGPFLNENMSPGGSTMPLSYNVWPKNYFDAVPASQRPSTATKAAAVKACNGQTVQPAQLNEYTFQTEKYIATLGLNIYDAAVWCVAKSLLGDYNTARNYMASVLLGHQTRDTKDIRGDATCKGDMFRHQCSDPNEEGACGFCYGDTATKTQDIGHAYFFRTVSDYYAVDGSVDARCPSLGKQWSWNDWKPILGENAWANLIGPLSTAYMAFGRNAAAIPDDVPEMTLATSLVPTLLAMRVGSTGAIYYAPRNTYFSSNPDAGSTVSIENQASTLAGLKGLRYVLQQKGASSKHYHLLGDVNTLITGLENFLVTAWNAGSGFFHQGLTFNPADGSWKWTQGDSPEFAVDCQTWVATALGATFIDQKLGANTAWNLWQTVKARGGYQKQSNGMVKGVGYTENSYAGEVFSGEWTFGAINWLRVMASDSPYTADQKAQLRAEADFMRQSVDAELTTSTPVQGGSASRPSILYSNKRYFIPFGWYANSIPAMASTGWAVAVDKNWNPLMVTGAMSSSYSTAPSPPAPSPPSPPAPSPSGSKACSANPGCAKIGLGGNCCPTDDGTVLACCNQ